MHEKAVGAELHSLTNLIGRRIENFVSLKYVKSLTGTNGWIIGYIAKNSDRDVFQKDLEEKFPITRSTASKVITLMEQKGLIERQSVPQDARLKKLVLTPKAWDLNKEIDTDFKNMESTLTRGFTKEEIDTLYSYIDRMKRNIE
jgi:DNA-binding MarR family transcriptional regulator